MLTKKEAATAAEAIRDWPREKSGFWALKQDENGYWRGYFLSEVVNNPDLAEHGWPAAIVAAVRGDLSEDGLMGSLVSVAMSLFPKVRNPMEIYIEELHNNPRGIAEGLFQYSNSLGPEEE